MKRVRIGVCDYGVGNLRSVERALLDAGAEPVISDAARELDSCDGLVLPGVGAFVAAAQRLTERGLGAVATSIAATGRPVLGVCLGHQLLFDGSDEGDGAAGLGLVPGTVTRIDAPGLKVPHMGWNTLRLERPSRLLDGIEDGAHMYFVHSYSAMPRDEADVVATTEYGGTIAAVVQRGSVLGTQFHPEKSGRNGLRLYANFAAICAGRPESAVVG